MDTADFKEPTPEELKELRQAANDFATGIKANKAANHFIIADNIRKFLNIIAIALLASLIVYHSHVSSIVLRIIIAVVLYVIGIILFAVMASKVKKAASNAGINIE